MLEIRYNKNTKVVTGWWSSSRFGNYEVKLKNRPDEAIIELDIPVPNKPPSAWLYDEVTQTLTPNPTYVEPKPPRDWRVEVGEIKARVETLEKK